MVIKDIKITNFGKFHDKEISFEKGMNIIYGENEAGKTTIHTFIRGMLFGIEKQRGKAGDKDTYTKYQPWENSLNYCGMMHIENNGITYRIERNFNKDNKLCVIVREDIGEELNDEEIAKLFSGLNENSYYNTISISQLGSATDKELEVILKNYAANLGSTKSTELDMKAALDELKASRKQIVSDNKLDRQKDILKERVNITQEIEISEQEQSNALENIENNSKKLEELIAKRNELTVLEESQKETIISSEVKKETLSNRKKELEKEVSSARSSKMELEYNLDNIKKFNEVSGMDSAEKIDEMLKKANKKSKITILSFILMLAFALLAAGELSGALLTSNYVIPFFADVMGTAILQSEYIYACILIAAVMGIIWIVSAVVHGNKRKKDLAKLKGFRENFDTLELLKKEIETQESGLEVKKKELDDASESLSSVEKQIEDIPDYKEEIRKLDEMINALNIEISRTGWQLEQNKTEEASLEGRLEELETIISNMETASEEVQAIDMAVQYIEAIGTEVRGSFGKTLNEKASEYIREITGGKYDNIVIDDKLNIKINSKDKLINLQRMSKGTVEQIYMALRLAAADILFENDSKPILMDDAFAMYDNKRMANTMLYMSRKLEQVIMFSCHTREKVMADKLGIKYNLIKL